MNCKLTCATSESVESALIHQAAQRIPEAKREFLNMVCECRPTGGKISRRVLVPP